METIFHIKTKDIATATLIEGLIERGLAEEVKLYDWPQIDQERMDQIHEERAKYLQGEGEN